MSEPEQDRTEYVEGLVRMDYDETALRCVALNAAVRATPEGDEVIHYAEKFLAWLVGDQR